VKGDWEGYGVYTYATGENIIFMVYIANGCYKFENGRRSLVIKLICI